MNLGLQPSAMMGRVTTGNLFSHAPRGIGCGGELNATLGIHCDLITWHTSRKASFFLPPTGTPVDFVHSRRDSFLGTVVQYCLSARWNKVDVVQDHEAAW